MAKTKKILGPVGIPFYWRLRHRASNSAQQSSSGQRERLPQDQGNQFSITYPEQREREKENEKFIMHKMAHDRKMWSEEAGHHYPIVNSFHLLTQNYN